MQVALMCPNNQFYGLLNQSYVSTYFIGTPTSTQRCTFLENSDDKLHYLSCDTNADIICDRPMQNNNYCNIMMNCTTTTQAPVVTTTTSTQSPSATATTSDDTNDSGGENCGDGYTRVFGWCVPWWAWLLFGLLLLLLLCCLLCWLLHCCCRLCLCWLPRETVYVEKQYTRRHVEQQTDLGAIEESIPISQTVAPPIIYDVTIYENNFNKEMIVPPAPYYSANNPAMLLPPPQEQDVISAASMSIYVDRSPPLSPKHIVHRGMVPQIDGNVTPLPTRDFPLPPPPPPPRDNSPERTPVVDLRRSITPPPRHIRRHSADNIPIIHKQPSSPIRSPFEVPESSPEPLILPPLPPVRKKKKNRPKSHSPIRKTPEFTKQSIASEPRSFPKPPPPKRSLDRTPPPSKRSIEKTLPSFTKRPIPKDPPSTRPSFPSKQSAQKSPVKKRRTPSEPRNRSNDDSLMKAPMKSPNDAGFRSARGQLGGVAGGRLGNRPDGWKPWAKSPNVFSGHPGFLDEDA
uniref:Uncharacterized protein n=1 Tax=Acrobeloides nanus TaxID=290746 RepID=A0A914EJ54_9BILA